MSRPSRPTIAQLRHRLYGLLEHGPVGDRAGRLVGQFIVALIVMNLVAVVLESVPAYEARFDTLFAAIELFSLVVFTLEYVLRVWVAVEHAPYRHLKKGVARWRSCVPACSICRRRHRKSSRCDIKCLRRITKKYRGVCRS